MSCVRRQYLWIKLMLILFFQTILCQTNLESTGHFECPCLLPIYCSNLPPYGDSSLDILLFGTHQPCPRYGEILCCPRSDDKTMPERWSHFYQLVNSSTSKSGQRKIAFDLVNMTNQWSHRDLEVSTTVSTSTVLPSTKADIHLEEVEELECGCIPKGICHTIGTETQDCDGNFELCCLNGEPKVEVNLLKPPKPVAVKKLAFVRPSPVFKPDSGQAPKWKKLECVERSKCKVAYGENHLDVSLYGSLAPCTDLSAVLCVTLHKSSIENLDKIPFQNLDEASNQTGSDPTVTEPTQNMFKEFELKAQNEIATEVLRDRPIKTLEKSNESSRPIKKLESLDPNSSQQNDFSSEEKLLNDNDASLTDFFPKSIPPSIYVDINGTLVISGGSPVIYLPSAPIFPFPDAQLSLDTTSQHSETNGALSTATEVLVTTEKYATQTSEEAPTQIVYADAVPPLEGKVKDTDREFKTDPEIKVAKETVSFAAPEDDTLMQIILPYTEVPLHHGTKSFLPVNPHQGIHPVYPVFIQTSSSTTESPTKSKSSTNLSINYLPTSHSVKPNVGNHSTHNKTTINNSSSNESRPNYDKILAYLDAAITELNPSPTPKIITNVKGNSLATTTTSTITTTPTSVPAIPTNSVDSNVSASTDNSFKAPVQEDKVTPTFFQKIENSAIPSENNKMLPDIASSIPKPDLTLNVKDSETVGHETSLFSSLKFFETISKFFLRSPETNVALTHGNQKLQFKVNRDKVVDFIGLFNEIKFERR